MVAVVTEQLMREIAAQIVGTYIDIDNGAGNQCWDSANYINEHFFKLPRINTWYDARWYGWAGNMVDAYPQSPEIEAAYELVAPTAWGQPGDTYVWGDGNQMWYPKTHVATLVAETYNGWPLFLSQNSSMARPDLPGYSEDSTGPVIYQNLPTEGLIGILRPRSAGTSLGYAGEIITPQEDELSDAQVDKIYEFVKTMNEQFHNATRANIIEEVSKKLADSAYEMKVWDQQTDNFTGDRIIDALTPQLASLAASVASSMAARGASVEEIQKAVEEALAKGVNVNITTGAPSNG